MSQGIYNIRNIITNQYYIGSSKELEKRLSQHRSDLRGNRHENIKLQRSWNKYGETSFVFQAQELVENKEDLIPTEQQWLDVLWDSILLFNMCKRAESRIYTPCSEDSKQKMRLAQKNMSEETRERKSKSHIGLRQTESTKEKLRVLRTGSSNPFFGKKHTEETKKLVSQNSAKYWKGKVLSEEHKNKLKLSALARYGREKSEI